MAHSGCLRCPLVSKTERFSNRQNGEAVSASPGGKLPSEVRLMRGGDRLAYKCSPMNGIRFRLHHLTGQPVMFSHRHPSSVTINNRFRSADYFS